MGQRINKQIINTLYLSYINKERKTYTLEDMFDIFSDLERRVLFAEKTGMFKNTGYFTLPAVAYDCYFDIGIDIKNKQAFITRAYRHEV